MTGNETMTEGVGQGIPSEMGHTLAAVVPCYNVGLRLVPVVMQLCEMLDHVFVVDDGSTDGAVAKIGVSQAQVLTFPENRGKGHTILAGFRAALEVPDVAAIAIVDADGQHDPRELPRLYEVFLSESPDLVIGARSFDRPWVPWVSRLGNTLTTLLTTWLLKQRVPDTQSGFRVHSRRLVEDVIASVPGGRYETEMEILVKAAQGGYKIATVPIQTIYEAGNPSSHFHRFSDSARVWSRLFAAALRMKRN